MPRYKVTVSTILSYTATVDAEDEDDAISEVTEAAKTFGNSLWTGRDGHIADATEEWQYETDVKELEDGDE